MQTLSDAIDRARELDLSHVQLAFFDHNGHLVGKRYNVANLEKATSSGIAFVEAIFTGDPSGRNIIETNRLIHPDRGFKDAVVRFDPATCRVVQLSGSPTELMLLGQFVGDAADYCPRALLDSELRRWQDIGIDVIGAFELECAMLQESTESLATKSITGLTTMPGFAEAYSVNHLLDQQAMVGELNDLCRSMGIEIETQHIELQHMLETSIRPQSGMRIADDAALFKNFSKQVARKHGCMMSFMARWHPEQQGCGAHINVSLRDASSGEPLFFGRETAGEATPRMQHFIGGLHAYLPELFLLLAPNLNSYKRFRPGLFTPLNNSWGINNKTVAYRAINSSPGAARLEIRPPGADVNAHLSLAAVLIAGRRGISERIDPPPPVQGDGFSLEDVPGPTFPATFEQAIEMFNASRIARESLSDAFVELFVNDRQWQIEQFASTITDWELRMFAEGA